MYRGQLPSAVNVECGTGDTRFPQPYHPRGSKSSGQMLAVSALAADVPPDAPPADVPKAVVAAASSVRQDGKWGVHPRLRDPRGLPHLLHLRLSDSSPAATAVYLSRMRAGGDRQSIRCHVFKIFEANAKNTTLQNRVVFYF